LYISFALSVAVRFGMRDAMLLAIIDTTKFVEIQNTIEASSDVDGLLNFMDRNMLIDRKHAV